MPFFYDVTNPCNMIFPVARIVCIFQVPQTRFGETLQNLSKFSPPKHFVNM